ncbi:MAG: DNA translocase FtsK 4TM domain-containing protein [Lentisphaeria bacterium]|nr:MAG: DNA translocase FtsK 4TM domain-containing protein [Lentisphaeria bacterium]
MGRPEVSAWKRGESGFRVRYVFYFAGLLLIFLAVLSYSPADGASITGGIDAPPRNWIGNLGAFLAYWLFNLFGLTTYVLLGLTLLRVIRTLLPGKGRPFLFLTGELMLLFGLMLLFALSPYPFVTLTDHLGIGRTGVPELALSGGAVGQVLAAPPVEAFALPEGVLRKLIGAVGTMIFGWALVTGGLIVIYFSDWHVLFRNHVFNIPRGEETPRAIPAPTTQGETLPAPAPAPATPAPAPAAIPGGLFGSARAALNALRERHLQGGGSCRSPGGTPQPSETPADSREPAIEPAAPAAPVSPYPPPHRSHPPHRCGTSKSTPKSSSRARNLLQRVLRSIRFRRSPCSAREPMRSEKLPTRSSGQPCCFSGHSTASRFRVRWSATSPGRGSRAMKSVSPKASMSRRSSRSPATSR